MKKRLGLAHFFKKKTLANFPVGIQQDVAHLAAGRRKSGRASGGQHHGQREGLFPVFSTVSHVTYVVNIINILRS